MTASERNRTVRLVIIDSDRNARGYVKRSFGDGAVRVVGDADDIKNGIVVLRGLQPDIVLIELPEHASETMEAVERIRAEHPNMGIILSKHNPSPQLILSGIRAGAQEFVGRPVDAPELRKAVEHVRRLMEKTVPTDHKRGTVLSVFASKGGIGATSVAANLAVALAGNDDARTVLVDLSVQMGDLSLMLDEPSQYCLADALNEGKVDEVKLRSVLGDHESGVKLLTVASGPDTAEDITRHHIVELFGVLHAMFDYVVVDLGRQLDDRTVEVLELSDGILLLSTLDVPSIRNTSRYIDLFNRLELERDKVHLIVNRFHKKTRIGLKDIEDALGVEPYWAIPNDFMPVSMGIDRGSPAVISGPRSKVARSIKDLAKHLIDEQKTQIASEAPIGRPTPDLVRRHLSDDMTRVNTPTEGIGNVSSRTV